MTCPSCAGKQIGHAGDGSLGSFDQFWCLECNAMWEEEVTL